VGEFDNCDNWRVSRWVGKRMSREPGESELGIGASSREGGGDLPMGRIGCLSGGR